MSKHFQIEMNIAQNSFITIKQQKYTNEKSKNNIE